MGIGGERTGRGPLRAAGYILSSRRVRAAQNAATVNPPEALRARPCSYDWVCAFALSVTARRTGKVMCAVTTCSEWKHRQRDKSPGRSEQVPCIQTGCLQHEHSQRRPARVL